MNNAPSPPGRLSWVDVARGIAVLWMVETHVCNAFLADALKQTAGFTRLNYLNGLVAPTFLTVSGYLLGISIKRGGGAFPRKFWIRLLALAGCGYALHFPIREVLAGDWPAALRAGCLVDVLQCLALSQTLFVLASRAIRPMWGVAVLTGFFVLASPWAYQWTGLTLPLQGFINPSEGALFPLFPWAGFAGLGVAAGLSRRREIWWAYGLAGGALALILPKPEPFTGSSLPFFLERLAWVSLGLGILERVGGDRFPAFIHDTGRKSLRMYVGHLVLLGAIWGIWQGSGGGGMGVWAVVGIWVGLVGTLIFVGRLLDRQKRIKES